MISDGIREVRPEPNSAEERIIRALPEIARTIEEWLFGGASDSDTAAVILALSAGFERCDDCGGSGLALNEAGEPDECRTCRGNTVTPLVGSGSQLADATNKDPSP